MSVKVSSWVWHGEEAAGLSGNEMILMLALADVADDNGRCRYLADDMDLTYDGLARKVRVDRRTIERLIPKLRTRGLVKVQRGSKSRPNEISILVPWGPRSADKVSGDNSDAPTAVQDSPTATTTFPDNGGNHTSYRRNDVDVLLTPGASDPDLFDDFWSLYPRKVGKEAARKAFAASAKKVAPSVIVEGARGYAADPNLPEKQYIPHPATWLSRGSWEDEALPPRAQPAAAGAPAPLSSDFSAEDSWMAFNR